MSSFLSSPGAHIIIGVVVGSLVAVLLHRHWLRVAPLRYLHRLVRRRPERITEAMGHSSVPLPEPTEEFARFVAGSGADAELIRDVIGLVNQLNRHSPQILQHGHQVASLCALMARERNLSSKESHQLILAALFHDAGWMSTRPINIGDPGPYSEELAAQIQGHGPYGQQLIAPVAALMGPAAEAISQHHERWDGTGYPAQLKKGAISSDGRLLMVADGYVSSTSGELGGAGLTPEAAVAAIVADSGTRYEPGAVRALLRVGLRDTSAAVVGGAAGGSALRLLVASWASTTTGVVTAGATIAALSAAPLPQPNDQKPARGVEVADVSTTASTVVERFERGSADTTVPAVASSVPTEQSADSQVPGEFALVDPLVATTAPPSEIVIPGQVDVWQVPATQAPADQTPVVVVEPDNQVATPVTNAPAPTAAPNQAPAVGNESVSMTTSQSISISVLSNDFDPDGSLQPSTLALTAAPTLGQASVNGQSIVYSAGSRAGSDRLRYRVCDNRGACSEGSVSITLTSNAPVAQDDFLAVTAGTTLLARIHPLRNDTGDFQTSPVSIISPPAQGSASVSDTVITYSSAPLTAGTSVRIGYRACDYQGRCANATITIAAQ